MSAAAMPHSQTGRAVVLMMTSTLFFALMAITIRIAAERTSIVEIAFFRNFFGLLALLPFLARSGRSVLHTTQWTRYLLRAAVGVAAMLCSFWALGNLPMAQAIALSYSSPLFVTIFAVLWLGEVVRRRRWTAVLLGFVGVVMIVRPGTDGFSLGSLVAIAGALLGSVVALQIKQLSRIDAPDTIVFYTYVFWVPLSLVPALTAWTWPQGIDWLWLVAIGVFGTGGQLFWTRALKLGEVSALTPISFMQLPLVTFLAWLLFGEVVGLWTIAGSMVILGANAYIAHRESQLSRRAATHAPVEAAKPGE
jgi:drug/metabolite transporter (DMT)-like permease